ncbi:MAG: ABC transporter substrate-binding protein [Actinomycetota bacterium]|nr:ABC transporter substrate-binding protein [Actinomycetota bacterium]
MQKLDPDVVTNFLDFQALGLIYDTLVQFNNKLQVTPDLATSWKFSDHNRVLTFQLRKGVKFDDGTTFTSADVVASLQRAENPKVADASASFLASMKRVVPVGQYAVKLELSRPDTSVLDGLTSINFAMLSKKAIAAGTLSKKPDGTGPYKFVSWSPNNSFTVAANPAYWGHKPSIQKIEIKTIASEQSIASALEAHTVQLGLLTEPQVADHLPKSFKVQKVLDLSYRALMLQDKTGPLANLDNRLALECAISRQQVVASAVLGQGQAVGPVPLGPYKSSPISAVCPTQNLAKARSYLKLAGDPGGFSFTAMTSTDLDPTSAAQATTVQADLARVGIHMTIQNLAGNSYIQDWLKGDFQAAFAENGADPDPYVMYGRYFGAGANLAVPAGYSSPALQKLLLKSDQATTPAALKAANAAVSRYLTANAVWDWLFDSYDYAVFPSTLHGFQLPPNRQLQSLKFATIS